LSISPTAWRRVVALTAGRAMLVTDLHGDKDAYDRYRDRFLTLQARGEADHLIIAGDLIHHSGPAGADRSVEMVLDLFRLQEEVGAENIIYLLGNHELPHIYAITLQKGDELFTPRFEKKMGRERERILSRFRQLPFYLVTPGGVTVTHAGATNAIGERSGTQRLFNFSHTDVLDAARVTITEKTRPALQRAVSRMYGRPYSELMQTLFGVTDPADPRYEDFLVGALATTGNEDFDLLWSALFNRNEKEYGNQIYKMVLRTMLQTLSPAEMPQQVMVTGHMDCRGGYKLVNSQQLRIASAKHAHPREAGVYLLWDVTKKISHAEQLVPYLHSVFS